MKKECVVKFLETCKEKTCGEISSQKCKLKEWKEKIKYYNKFIEHFKSLDRKDVTVGDRDSFYKTIEARKFLSQHLRNMKKVIKSMDRDVSTINYAIKCLNEVKE